MESKVTARGNFERVVEVDVPEQELTPHFEQVYRRYRKGVRLEGFRKGKVPLDLIKKLYGDVIKSEAIDDVVQSVFKEVRQKEDLHPVAPAKLEDVQYDEEKGLQFKAVVEVVPEVKLASYKNLTIERELYQVDEEDVTEALDEMRERMAVMELVDGEALENHFVVADFQQIDSTGVPLLGRKFEDRLIQLTSEDNTSELSDQLVGSRAGETRRVVLQVDENEGEPEEEFYQVLVKEVKAKKLPDLDDELAKDTGKFETLSDLKQDIKENLIKQADAGAKRHGRQLLIDELLKKNALELPESMVANYLDAVVEEARKDSRLTTDEETFRSQYRASAVRTIKWELFKEKLAELEAVSVSDADKDDFIARVSQDRGVDEKAIRKSLKKKDAMRHFEEDILEQKVLDLLESYAKIKDSKVTKRDIEKRRKQIAV